MRKNDVELNAKDGLINIENGELNVNDSDDITGATINITNKNGTFNYGIENNQEFQLGAFDGNVNILENANLTLKNGSSVTGKLNLQKDATLSMKNGTLLIIGNTSNWDGAIKNDGGRITVDDIVNTSSTASFVQTSGSTDINNSNITFNKNSAIKGGDVYIFDSALNLENSDVTGGNISLVGNSKFNYTGGNFNIDKLNASNGTENILINTMNGEINNSTIGSMDIKSQANFYIDIIGTETDQFKISSLSDDSKLFIKDWNLSGNVPAQRNIQLGYIFVDGNGNPINGENISITNKKISNSIGQQNWHSDYGQIGMMAGMMHGVNIAPGVNLIWEKETFSTYLTLQYMYNVNGAVNGKAGNVDLPNVKMERGYIQYGIGATKKLTDRCAGYFQAVLRNVGRTGVGFQAGFSIKLGKKNK